MLDTNTKRKIDNARDILVGILPIPKSQIDLITLTLIYKFMYDMDQLSIECGGIASYFVGDYEKYSWEKILDQSLSGFERVKLFDEGLIKMHQNPNLPELFRDIFRNAYLPFRSSETLNMFLEEMNGFDYSHSENLGDAFEYLLSKMSTQGDAGQFRTPRHIIDFIVKLVDPNKDDKILDPACGTAGFLITAYKHIMQKHEKEDSSGLSNDKLVNNIVGYDISPDMVRLSLVNMYLHKFPNPNIFAYDTLTQEEKWNDHFSCILANPPFMSPKGGIKPHERFAIKSKRSEVLFVDYMMEHLTPDGKAGIIIPEGIIFQSQNAHKTLRKKMVEQNFLWAVVSLPSGVFQPYSGVKTSILLFDKTKAKATDKIVFAKVEYDGFSLSAQRQPIKKNDLPTIIANLSYFYENNDLKLKVFREGKVFYIKKDTLFENDYNLNFDKYFDKRYSSIISNTTDKIEINSTNIQAIANLLSKPVKIDISGFSQVYENLTQAKGIIGLSIKNKLKEFGNVINSVSAILEYYNQLSTSDKEDFLNKLSANQSFPLAKLGDVCEIVSGQSPSSEFYNSDEEGVPFYQGKSEFTDMFIGKPTKWTTKITKEAFPNDILMSVRAPVGPVNISTRNCCIGRGLAAVRALDEVDFLYVFYILKYMQKKIKGNGGSVFDSISNSQIRELLIPFPDIETQKEIVGEIECYQKIIDGAKQIVENHKPHIDIDPEWELVELGNAELFEIQSGGTPSSKEPKYWGGEISWATLADLPPDDYITNIIKTQRTITQLGLSKSSAKIFEQNSVLISSRATIGRVAINKVPISTNQGFKNIIIKDKSKMDPFFLAISIKMQKDNLINMGTGGTYKEISKSAILKVKVPLPPIVDQRQIVSRIEEEQKYVDGCKKLIEIYEEKIKDRIDKVWEG